MMMKDFPCPRYNIVLQLKDFLLGLRDNYGFAIDVGRLETALYCIDDITDVEEVVYRLQSMICQDETQIQTFRNVFAQKFLGVYILSLSKKKSDKNNDPQKQMKNAQKELDDVTRRRKNLERDIDDSKDRIEMLREKLKREEKEADSSQKKIEEQEQQIQKDLRALSPMERAKQNPRMERQLGRIVRKAKDAIEQARNTSDDDISELEGFMEKLDDVLNSAEASTKIREIVDILLRRAVTYTDVNRIAPAAKTLSILAELCDTIVGKDSLKSITQKKKELKKFNDQKQEGRRHIKDIQSELEHSQNSQKSSAEKLEKAKKKEDEKKSALKALRMQDQVIEKEKSEHHRDVFTEINARAVQTTAEEAKLLSEPITRLSSQQMQMVSAYIRANARAFRQTLRRSASTPIKRRIDVRLTMRQAAKTGGEPMIIKYKRPIKSHAKIVCLVDISGSCRKAASVALYFMALMNEAFPGGVHKFAFVNALVPVDRFFQYQSAADAVEAVNKNVPSRGIYSDYGATLHELRENYASLFDKETTLIVLGDARNNKRNNREEDVKFFCEKSRRVFWLNPDASSKWGQGDSETIAYKNAGVDMRHIATVGDLLSFLVSAAQ